MTDTKTPLDFTKPLVLACDGTEVVLEPLALGRPGTRWVWATADGRQGIIDINGCSPTDPTGPQIVRNRVEEDCPHEAWDSPLNSIGGRCVDCGKWLPIVSAPEPDGELELDRRTRQIELWFFRDLFDAHRDALFALCFGTQIADEAKHNSHAQRLLLRRILGDRPATIRQEATEKGFIAGWKAAAAFEQEGGTATASEITYGPELAKFRNANTGETGNA